MREWSLGGRMEEEELIKIRTSEVALKWIFEIFKGVD